MRYKDHAVLAAAVIAVSLLVPELAFATLEQSKIYKSAFNTEKPKCLTCHVDKIPKKEDGKHELNEYGKKLASVNPAPDEATYKQVGPNPDAVF